MFQCRGDGRHEGNNDVLWNENLNNEILELLYTMKRERRIMGDAKGRGRG
jgi:hypothetical protein